MIIGERKFYDRLYNCISVRSNGIGPLYLYVCLIRWLKSSCDFFSMAQWIFFSRSRSRLTGLGSSFRYSLNPTAQYRSSNRRRIEKLAQCRCLDGHHQKLCLCRGSNTVCLMFFFHPPKFSCNKTQI